MAKKKKGGIRKAIKAAGSNISRKEMKSIAKAAGGNVKKALKQITKAGANLNSGAANMLIKQQQASPFAFGRSGLGDSKIAQTIRQMAGTPDFRSAKQRQMGLGTGAVTGTGPLPGGMMIRPGGRSAVRKQAGGAAPTVAAPVETQAPTEPVDTGDEFDYASMFGDMMSMMPDYGAMFGDLQSQMAGMFDELASQFDTPDPIQLAALGQAYGGDMIRARQRQRKTRADYLRNQMNNMALGGGSSMSPLMIGGGVTL